MIDDAVYDEIQFQCGSGDSLLIFSDGVIEILDADGHLLGTEGLISILKSLEYPESRIRMESLQKALLTSSNEIRLDDDLSLLEVRFL